MKQSLPLLLLLALGAPALGQTEAQQDWATACAERLDLEQQGQVEASSHEARTRGGEIVSERVSVRLDGLTIARHVFSDEREAARFHRARGAWEPSQPTVAQLRGRQVVVLAGPLTTGAADLSARALAAAWSGEAQPKPGRALELSLSRPWRDEQAGLEGVDRVALSRLSGVGHSGTYHADVTSAVQRARQGQSESAHFLDVPLRNHLVEPGGDDALQELRLGADGVALHADVRDTAAAKLVWEALKALLTALEDPGFSPAVETVGPAGGPARAPRHGPPVDGALGD